MPRDRNTGLGRESTSQEGVLQRCSCLGEQRQDRHQDRNREADAAACELHTAILQEERNSFTTRAGEPQRFKYVRSALKTIERHAIDMR